MTHRNEIIITKNKLYIWLGANVVVIIGGLIKIIMFMASVETELTWIKKELNQLWTLP